MTTLAQVLAPLIAIADAFDANELDDEARKFTGYNPLDGRSYNMVNDRPPHTIELYSGRGGKRLLTLEDCLNARDYARKNL